MVLECFQISREVWETSASAERSFQQTGGMKNERANLVLDVYIALVHAGWNREAARYLSWVRCWEW